MDGMLQWTERRKVHNHWNPPANGLTIRYLGVLRLLVRFTDRGGAIFRLGLPNPHFSCK
ncbi:hypothetical protein D3C75_1152580 [compost metagenome]